MIFEKDVSSDMNKEKTFDKTSHVDFSTKKKKKKRKKLFLV